MPFTFSHPAIVLPFINRRKKLFSTTGLLIGCMIPDFESFIRLNQYKLYSHTWLGVFWYDLPLAIIFAFIFHNIVRDPFIKSLPSYFENKFRRFIGFNWNAFFRKHILMVIASMLVGIVSHLLWDALTHLNLLNPNAIDSQVRIGRFRLYKVLQYSNSLIGMIIVFVYVFKLPADTIQEDEVKSEKMVFFINPPKPGKHAKFQYWTIASCIAILTMVISVSYINDYIDIILLIDIVISGCLLSLILTPVVQKISQMLIAKRADN